VTARSSLPFRLFSSIKTHLYIVSSLNPSELLVHCSFKATSLTLAHHSATASIICSFKRLRTRISRPQGFLFDGSLSWSLRRAGVVRASSGRISVSTVHYLPAFATWRWMGGIAGWSHDGTGFGIIQRVRVGASWETECSACWLSCGATEPHVNIEVASA